MKRINLLLVVCVVLFSCNNTTKNNTSKGVILQQKKGNDYIKLAVGSWKDTTASHLDFTLFEDGTAQSDNMKSLLYKNWKIDGNKITFTIESIGNGTSFFDDETFTIHELTSKKMVLKKGNVVSMIMLK